MSLLFALVFAFPVLGQGIVADSLWLRESIPGQPNGAGFGTIENHSSNDMVLVSAQIDIAGEVQVHEHVHENGQMRMQRMEGLTINAGSSVMLRPGGYHLMLLGLQQPLVSGDTHRVTLLFSDGTQVEVETEVKPLVRQHQH
ncbi:MULTISPECIES: copper chaperone PCu(A)C [Gammaproteobacteria]|uniref:copper chaperone PCu(A)C n=1 Tax=Gammaproteobacteria TaxID=1236 RepID=UPI00140301C9|nr:MULTISPECIES: copper chaperone PCu(A)C [Gammaproteobacteria]